MGKKTVGIIGNGFVGESQAFAFSPTADVRVYDIDPLKATHTLEETLPLTWITVCPAASQSPAIAGIAESLTARITRHCSRGEMSSGEVIA